MSRFAAVTHTLLAAAAIALISPATNSALAQQVSAGAGSVEFRVSSGALVATGQQSEQLRNAELTAAQLSWLLTPRLALTGNFSWARSRDITTSDRHKLDVFTSDIGAEVRSSEWFADSPVSFSGFVGAGGGMRSYNYRKLDLPATNNVAAYLSIGGEVGIGRVGLRLEARDYISGFKPLSGVGSSATRNDLVIAGALRFNRRAK